jgi:hypothetical protein
MSQLALFYAVYPTLPNTAVHGSEIDNFKIKASNPQKE